MKAWHFVRADRTLGYDLTEKKIRKGMGLRTDEPIELCHSGFHGSIRPLDALNCAPGPIICRTEHSGEILEGDDKIVSSVRKVLWWADATNVLHHFACDEAERALTARREAGDEPDKRSWEAIEAKRLWLQGEATDKDLAAARDAASVAAWAAASAAAWAAASAAASVAARAAARDAAWAAASVAAWAAARDAQNERLEAKLMELER